MYVRRLRSKHYASLALSLALSQASFGQARYKSLGNGMADITLDLSGDNNFKLDFNDIAKQKRILLKGTWTQESGNYILTFNRIKTDLGSLFTSNSGFRMPARVADKKTLVFPATQPGLMIWGIYCEKESV